MELVFSDGRQDWIPRAACRGLDVNLFFGEPTEDGNARREKGRWKRVKQAKDVCESCPVEMQCLMWALTALPHGIAGGMTQRERERLRTMLELDVNVE